jgi:hypothetical protein
MPTPATRRPTARRTRDDAAAAIDALVKIVAATRPGRAAAASAKTPERSLVLPFRARWAAYIEVPIQSAPRKSSRSVPVLSRGPERVAVLFAMGSPIRSGSATRRWRWLGS